MIVQEQHALAYRANQRHIHAMREALLTALCIVIMIQTTHAIIQVMVVLLITTAGITILPHVMVQERRTEMIVITHPTEQIQEYAQLQAAMATAFQ